MKKTLITLAALAASVASAATVTDSYTADDFSNGVLALDTTLDYVAGNSWTLTAEITIGEGTYNSWGTPALATGGDVMSGSGLQVYFTNKDYEGTTEHPLRTVWFGSSHDSGVMSGTHAGDVLTLTYSYDGTKTADQLTIGYTLVRNGTFYSDNLSNDNWYKATVSSVNPAAISQLSTTLSGVEGWAINSITTTYTTPDAPAVPEPATATLSLLALAGLAARRRRK